MPLLQLRIANFGRTKANATGSTGVGYVVLDETGVVTLPRTTVGVHQTAPGIYAAYVPFPDVFRGQIQWDTGTTFVTASYASEEYNVESNDPRTGEIWQMVNNVTGAINALYDQQFGRWKIVNNQMLFFAPDNTTLLATFNLFDENGIPTMDAVFERVKV